MGINRLLFFGILLAKLSLSAQTIIYDFDSLVCLSERIKLSNNSSDSSRYVWVFCHDLFDSLAEVES
ncbi:MAG: hypothetical protein JXR10_14680, partial [Cyclobacteriaceae bacterium]